MDTGQGSKISLKILCNIGNKFQRFYEKISKYIKAQPGDFEHKFVIRLKGIRPQTLNIPRGICHSPSRWQNLDRYIRITFTAIAKEIRFKLTS